MSFTVAGTAFQDSVYRSGLVGPYASGRVFRTTVPLNPLLPGLAPTGIPAVPPSNFGELAIVPQEEYVGEAAYLAQQQSAFFELYGPVNQVIRSACQLNTRGIGTGFLNPIAQALEKPFLAPLNIANYQYQDIAQYNRGVFEGERVPIDTLGCYGRRW